MSPDILTGRLNTVADEVDAARRLVQAGEMACAGLEPDERDPLCELLDDIARRLNSVAIELRRVEQ